jgi:hypothetical protein
MRSFVVFCAFHPQNQEAWDLWGGTVYAHKIFTSKRTKNDHFAAISVYEDNIKMDPKEVKYVHADWVTLY